MKKVKSHIRPTSITGQSIFILDYTDNENKYLPLVSLQMDTIAAKFLHKLIKKYNRGRK